MAPSEGTTPGATYDLPDAIWIRSCGGGTALVNYIQSLFDQFDIPLEDRKTQAEQIYKRIRDILTPTVTRMPLPSSKAKEEVEQRGVRMLREMLQQGVEEGRNTSPDWIRLFMDEEF